MFFVSMSVVVAPKYAFAVSFWAAIEFLPPAVEIRNGGAAGHGEISQKYESSEEKGQGSESAKVACFVAQSARRVQRHRRVTVRNWTSAEWCGAAAIVWPGMSLRKWCAVWRPESRLQKGRPCVSSILSSLTIRKLWLRSHCVHRVHVGFLAWRTGAHCA